MAWLPVRQWSLVTTVLAALVEAADDHRAVAPCALARPRSVYWL